ncbi:MAG TPA: divalent cation tolerance protein CutA [Nitrososphaera sp.]|nr:divalent cation tolerance protein CutA [Nitrososphaera sp.]
MTADFVQLVLTCGSWQEAQRIADSLLEQKLVGCAEMLAVKSKSWWQNRLEETDEIKLIMESVTGHFDRIEQEVAKLHSYDTFVLQQVPINRLSSKAQSWLTEVTEVK